MISDAANSRLIDAPRALNLAREALDIEAAALRAMSVRLNGAFTAVVQRILQLPGRVVVMGMGAAGMVAAKTAADNGAKVVIGSNVLFGPSVQLYTASHPLDAGLRRQGLEFGKPIVIGDDVWVGGNAVICPGVTIGAGAVIGAGSVVTRDVPPAVLAAGNPCRVIRPL